MTQQINNELELLQIGGPEKYKQYFSRIKAFIKSNPTKDETAIAKATNIPLIAIRRALREGVYEQATNIAPPDDAEFRKAQAALLTSIVNSKKAAQPKAIDEKSKLLADLSARKNQQKK